MRTIKTMAAGSVLILAFYVSLSAGTASAKTLEGTSHGDALYGTAYGDTIHGYGGGDLAYGYGGTDLLYGGNETGRGDKLLGGAASDLVLGQKGDDALYGQYGHDLLVGGDGEDTLDGGPGSDEINARDGQKDTIVIRPGEYDTIYYDEGLDVLQEQAISEGTSDRSADLTASGTGKVEMLAERPPAGLFGHTGRVLVEHRGEELLVPEGELGGHIGHGDEIIDPTGRAESERGRG